MAYRILMFIIVVVFAFPAANCEAQKLKLPNLLPFKKKSSEVKPFELTDRSSGSRSRADKKQLFDFLKNNNRPPTKAGPLEDFNRRSKAFFERTGQEIGKFSENTKKFFSDAWNPPKARTAWWNQGPKKPGSGEPLIAWPGSSGQSSQQPAMPTPRSAHQYQYGQPKHKFR